MLLKKREKILALVIVSLLAVVILQQAYTKLRGPQSGLKNQRESLAAELQRKKTRLQNAKKAAERLNKWRERSLPADPETAQLLYQNWLLGTARDAAFSDTAIGSSPKRSFGAPSKDSVGDKKDYSLRFELDAKTTLDGLTKFLHKFYNAGYLHQIVSLTVTPIKGENQLKIHISISALSLAEAKSKNELPKVSSDNTLEPLKTYLDRIGKRNLFAAYKPPDLPATKKPKPDFDPVKFAFLTGITSDSGRQKAWIVARTTGDKFELFEGDTFNIGETKCKMIKVGERDALIEIDGKRFLVPLGKGLRDAEALPKAKVKLKSEAQPKVDGKAIDKGITKTRKDENAK